MCVSLSLYLYIYIYIHNIHTWQFSPTNNSEHSHPGFDRFTTELTGLPESSESSWPILDEVGTEWSLGGSLQEAVSLQSLTPNLSTKIIPSKIA